ncbi:putative Zinc finger, RING/FYVE/PHD-type [Helianthus annuus]|nr:putative Zinc finger, RING/FYVE/PHD-type [Helianthus annuus]
MLVILKKPRLEDQFDDYNDAEHDMLFGQFADNVDSALVQPPASKRAVDDLLSVMMTIKDHEDNNAHCAVCKDEIGVGEMAKQLPCAHHYSRGLHCSLVAYTKHLSGFVAMSCRLMILAMNVGKPKGLLVVFEK